MNSLAPRLLISIFVASLFLVGCDRSTDLPSETQGDIGTVALEVDFGDDKPSKQIDVVCSPNSTVLLSLERAEQLDKLVFESKGSGETAFVTTIDGVGNDAQGKNWIYRVNGELGDKSAGILSVKPGDKISWIFGTPPAELQ